MSADPSIAIPVETLLELRHRPLPGLVTAPESNSTWLGSFRSRKRGQGTDYDDLRHYSAGDDIRHIDWRASARNNQLHTRLYREEKEHRTTIICDLRPCMFTGSQELRANRAVMLSAKLLWHACQSGTRTNVLVLGSNGATVTAPGAGHIAAIRGCALLSKAHQRTLQLLSTKQGNPAADERPDSRLEADGIQAHHYPLTIDQPMQGPTLTTALKWLVSQSDRNADHLWITGMDFEGKNFYQTLGASNKTRRNLMVLIDDPMMHTPLPSGTYQYLPQGTTTTNTRQKHLIAKVTKATRATLSNHLERQRKTRIARFDELMIPLLSNVNGDDELIAMLRHQTFLA